MKTATTGLMAASGEVIDNHDQYEVSPRRTFGEQWRNSPVILGLQYTHRGKLSIHMKQSTRGRLMGKCSRIQLIPS